MKKVIFAVAASMLVFTGCANNMTPQQRIAFANALEDIGEQQTNYGQQQLYRAQQLNTNNNARPSYQAAPAQKPTQSQWICPNGKKSGPMCDN